jgi:hypothetical protein
MSKDFEILSFYHFCLFLEVFSAWGGGRHQRKKWAPLVRVGISNRD